MTELFDDKIIASLKEELDSDDGLHNGNVIAALIATVEHWQSKYNVSKGIIDDMIAHQNTMREEIGQLKGRIRCRREFIKEL